MTQKSKKILLVEDDKWFREYLEGILAVSGYEVISTMSAYEAIDIVDSEEPDIIILDMLLPGANGMALLNELISFSDTRVIPVILCSSVVDSLNTENLSNYNVKMIFDKSSMEPDDLLSGIKKVLM